MNFQSTPYGHGLRYRDHFIFPRIEGESGELKALGFNIRDEFGHVVYEHTAIDGEFDTPAKAEEAITKLAKIWIDAASKRQGN